MAVSQLSRMQFLRGGRTNSIRPPWALFEQEFVEQCSRCAACINHCPEKILQQGRGGFPEVDFSRGECTFCQQCVDACHDQALQIFDETLPPWYLKVSIGEQCLAAQGVVCITCKEQCEPQAISMNYQAGRVPIPEIDDVACTGCGACYAPCPVSAIAVTVAQSVVEERAR